MAPETDITLVTRDEFKSEIGRVEAVLSTQIGAVEHTVTAKLGSVKAWGIAALVGGQALAGVLSAVFGPGTVAHTAAHVIHYLT